MTARHSRMAYATLALSLLAPLLAGAADEPCGKVAQVLGRRVTITLAAGQVLHEGTVVQIGSAVPGLGFVPLEGTWQVISVDAGVARAEPVGRTAGGPAPGMSVVATAETAEPDQDQPPPRVVRHPNSKASYALPEAVRRDDGDKVAALLAGGADPDHETFGGWTVLMEACRVGGPGIVTQLLRAGGNPDAATTEAKDPGMEGTTPIMVAAKQRRPEVIELLLAAGADPNAKTEDGTTALHLAAHSGSPRTVSVLLTAGADATVTDAKGRTPLDLAGRTRHQQIMQLINSAANR